MITVMIMIIFIAVIVTVIVIVTIITIVIARLIVTVIGVSPRLPPRQTPPSPSAQLGKGQMGSALKGSLTASFQIACFLTNSLSPICTIFVRCGVVPDRGRQMPYYNTILSGVTCDV